MPRFSGQNSRSTGVTIRELKKYRGLLIFLVAGWTAVFMQKHHIAKIAIGEEVLERIFKHLEAFGAAKYGKRIYATESYQDCLQKIMFRAWREPVAVKASDKDLYRYFRTAIDNCIRDAFRRAKRTDLLLVGDAELISDEESSTARPGNPRRELESADEVALMKSWFSGKPTMHEYIDHLTSGAKPAEIAHDMKLKPRQVTDFRRRLKRRLKRYLAERGDPRGESRH